MADHLQSTRAVLDESGTVVQTIDYDSFGVINDLRDANGNTIEFGVLGGESGLDLSQLATTFAFAGRVWDNDAGLYYNRARWYEPESGRFISVDPIEDGANWYAYAGNAPLNYRDPYGLSQTGNPLDRLSGSFSDIISGGSSSFNHPIFSSSISTSATSSFDSSSRISLSNNFTSPFLSAI